MDVYELCFVVYLPSQNADQKLMDIQDLQNELEFDAYDLWEASLEGTWSLHSS